MRIMEAGRSGPISILGRPLEERIMIHNYFRLSKAWAIHPAVISGPDGQIVNFVDSSGSFEYTLTHVPTGYCALHYPTPFAAARAASWLNSLPGIDWETATYRKVKNWATHWNNNGGDLYATLTSCFRARGYLGGLRRVEDDDAAADS